MTTISCHCRYIVHAIVFSNLFLLGAVVALPDQLYLRDNVILEGEIVRATPRHYIFNNLENGLTQTVPRPAVKFAIYKDPQQAGKQLGLEKWQSFCRSKSTAQPVDFLPGKAFGQSILSAVQQAQTSIYISAYFISGSRASPIKEFYGTLRQKAAEGLDVVVITEFGTRTSLQIRQATMDFAETLSSSGAEVFYVQDNKKAMHKKLIIIDEKTVFLGSSNLTMAGTSVNNEMNVKISQGDFLKDCLSDFKKIKSESNDITKLEF